MSKRDWEAYSKSTYDWKPGHEKRLRLTKSSLTSDFDFCPKQYEYKRIHKLPEPGTEAMTRGTNVHDAVEQLDDRHADVPPFIGSAGSNADARLAGVEPSTRTTPAPFAYQLEPSRGRREHLSHTLCVDCEGT